MGMVLLKNLGQHKEMSSNLTNDKNFYMKILDIDFDMMLSLKRHSRLLQTTNFATSFLISKELRNDIS